MNDDIFRLLNDLQINALLFFSLLCGILLAFIMNVIFFFSCAAAVRGRLQPE